MAYVTVLTNDGEAAVIDKLDTATKYDYIGWGTDATEAAKAQSGLVAEGAEDRVQGTVTQPTADKYQVVSTITCAGAGKTIKEAGLFNAVDAGTMLIRGNFADIVLAVADKIEFTISLEIT